MNMIAFSACVGIGLFLQSGKVIFLAGPGLAVVAYLIAGSVMWCTMGSLGEMTALFPIQGSIFVFPARFVDEGVGYAAYVPVSFCPSHFRKADFLRRILEALVVMLGSLNI